MQFIVDIRNKPRPIVQVCHSFQQSRYSSCKALNSSVSPVAAVLSSHLIWPCRFSTSSQSIHLTPVPFYSANPQVQPSVDATMYLCAVIRINVAKDYTPISRRARLVASNASHSFSAYSQSIHFLYYVVAQRLVSIAVPLRCRTFVQLPKYGQKSASVLSASLPVRQAHF